MNILAELAALAAGFSGTMGLWARDLQTGETIQFGAAHESFPCASTIKLAVFYEVMRQATEGTIDLAATWPLTAADQVPGSGVLKELTPGLRLPIRDLATLMMVVSDNTATNLCIDIVGIEAVNRSMEGLGLPGIKLYNKLYRSPPEGPKNQAVPSQLGKLMEHIVRQQVLTPDSCEAMLGIMKRAQGPYFGRFLPELAGIPPAPGEVTIASKLGCITGCRHEVGAVWKDGRGYVLSVMTRDCQDHRWVEENEGQLLVGRAAAAVHRYFLWEP